MKPTENYIQYIWNYFEYHANQRITLFRFYLIFFSIFAIAVAHLIINFHRISILEEVTVIILSLAFIYVTCIFYCLDKRNRDLIHNSEDFFKAYEGLFNQKELSVFQKNKVNLIKIFTREDDNTNAGKSPIRHTQCFNKIFVMGVILASIFVLIGLGSIPSHFRDKSFDCNDLTINACVKNTKNTE